MNLRQIEVFKAVMVTGSVSDASRLLHVSAPAVSQTLAHTESRLGFPLFERIKGRLYPTSEARRLFQEVEQVYRGVQRIERLTHELGQRRQAFLSVVASPSIGQMVVPQALAYFGSGNPEVRISFQSLSFDFLKEKILSRQCDLGISILPVDHPSLHTLPIARSRMMCICPRGHMLAALKAVTQRDLLRHRVISYPPDTPFGARLEQWFARSEERPQMIVEVGSPQNACALVQAGAGVAVVDEFSLLGIQVPNFHAIPVADSDPIVADLVYLRSEPLSPVAEAFVRALRSVLLERGLAEGQDGH